MDFQQMVADNLKNSLLKYDKIIFYILLAHLPVTMFIIPMGYDTMTFAIIASLAVGALSAAAYFMLRGTRLFGITAGVLLMAFSAIMIQSQMGRIEMHFHIFSALALLLLYRDWAAVVAAAGAIAVHHVLFTALQLNDVQAGGLPVMLFNYDCNWGITFLHAAFVVFESAILIFFSIMMRKEELTGVQLTAAVTQIQKENDLSVRIPDDDGKNAVATAFNNMIGKFDQLITNLTTASDNLAHMASSLLNASQDAHSNISTQHGQTEQSATAMTEMSATIQEVAQNAQLAANAASDADNEAQSGAKVVNNAISMTNELITSMNQASDSISQLEVNAQNIGSVVDVISGISEQTNLLALNAAIEAARAGEQGRGFAVVADEVRTLAQRTQESTSEIQSIIESLQSVTGQAVANISAGQDKTSETAEEIGKAGQALQSIVDGISHINGMNTQIATAAEQQSVVAESITENIVSISNLSKDTVGKIEENQAAASSLQEVSSSINSQISIYKS